MPKHFFKSSNKTSQVLIQNCHKPIINNFKLLTQLFYMSICDIAYAHV